MAVPKQHKTKSRRDQRRMHIYLEKPKLIKCSKCGAMILPHTVCYNCGYYKGKQVIDVLSKLTKKERKEKEKEMKAAKKMPKDRLSMEELSKTR